MGSSNLRYLKPKFWLLFLNLFSSRPHLSVTQLYSTSYSYQKPSILDLFSLIPHLGLSHSLMLWIMPPSFYTCPFMICAPYSTEYNTYNRQNNFLKSQVRSHYIFAECFSCFHLTLVKSKVRITAFKSLSDLTIHHLFDPIFYLSAWHLAPLWPCMQFFKQSKSICATGPLHVTILSVCHAVSSQSLKAHSLTWYFIK